MREHHPSSYGTKYSLMNNNKFFNNGELVFVVSEIMKRDKFRQRLRDNMKKLEERSGSSNYSTALSKVLPAILGGIIGWVLRALLTQDIQEQEL